MRTGSFRLELTPATPAMIPVDIHLPGFLYKQQDGYPYEQVSDIVPRSQDKEEVAEDTGRQQA